MNATPIEEKQVEIQTEDGVMPTFLSYPAHGDPAPAVILYMDIFGPREEMKEMCRRLSRHGYAALLPNLFYRAGSPEADVLMENRKLALELNGSTKNRMVIQDGAAIVEFCEKEPDIDGSRIGTIGTCMGGRHAMLAAAEYPDNIKAFASIHGGRLFSDAEDSPHNWIPKLKAEGYFGWASNDAEKNPRELEIYRHFFASHDSPCKIELFDDALHGYFFPERDRYNEEAAEKGWSYILEMFKRRLW